MKLTANTVATLRQRLAALLTVLGLSSVGYAGHSSHWTFHWNKGARVHSGPSQPEDGAVRKKSKSLTEEYGERPISHRTPDGKFRISFPTADAIARAGVTLSSIEDRALTERVTANGEVAYDERYVAQLSTRVQGTVWRVLKHHGQEVRKREILALVESEEVGRLKAEFLNGLVTMEVRAELAANLDRVKDAVTGRQVREAQAALREARIRLLNCEQALVNLGFELNVDDFIPLNDAQRMQTIRTLGVPPDQIAELNLERITSNLLPLFAPFDGIIIGHSVVVGEVVDPMQATFEIADTRRMWLTLDLGKESAGRVAVGQALRFEVLGLPQPIESRITWISTEVDKETRTLKVRADVENPLVTDPITGEPRGRLLRAQTFGTGRIALVENMAARVVPRNCVQWDGDQHVLFVQVNDHSFDCIPVTLGITSNDFTEVHGDLPASARVVNGGSHALKSALVFSRMETAAN